MLAAAQFSAAEIAIGVVVWFMPRRSSGRVNDGILFDRREYRDWKRDREGK